MSGDLDKIKSNKTEFHKWRKKLVHSVKATHRSDLPMLTIQEINAFTKHAPPPRGNPRGDDQKILSGIFFQIQTGCRICDIPREYGFPTTIYNRFQRWSRLEVFKKTFDELAIADPDNKYAMADSSFSKANRIACSGIIEKGHDRLIGLTKVGWNTKSVSSQRSTDDLYILIFRKGRSTTLRPRKG